MKLAMLGFTRRGTKLCAALSEGLLQRGNECQGYALKKYMGEEEVSFGLLTAEESLSQWTRARFDDCDGLVFIGAAGIAVRLIAPFVADKRRDPAVVVVDEKGQFAVSLLSGHLGGANGLAKTISEVTGGVPVITTATDVNGTFAVDLYAKEHGLWIDDMKLAKEITADILDGKPVGFFHDYEDLTESPEGTSLLVRCHKNIRVTAAEPGSIESEEMGPGTLRLIPAVTVVGVGCRKGASADAVMSLVERVLKMAGLSVRSLAALGTIELKAGEPGLVSCAKRLGVPLYTFKKEELEQQPGAFTSSDFVLKTTGVDNVCERSAMAVCNMTGGGSMVIRKQSENGVTAAVAVKNLKYLPEP